MATNQNFLSLTSRFGYTAMSGLALRPPLDSNKDKVGPLRQYIRVFGLKIGRAIYVSRGWTEPWFWYPLR